MLRRCAHLLLIIALLFSIGGHWALLQTAAWAGMMVSYAQEGALSDALSKTFDGEHPCQFCQAVQRGQQDQQENDTLPTEKGKKAELIAESVGTRLFSPWRLTSDYLPLMAKASPPVPTVLLAPPRAG